MGFDGDKLMTYTIQHTIIWSSLTLGLYTSSALLYYSTSCCKELFVDLRSLLNSSSYVKNAQEVYSLMLPNHSSTSMRRPMNFSSASSLDSIGYVPTFQVPSSTNVMKYLTLPRDLSGINLQMSVWTNSRGPRIML